MRSFGTVLAVVVALAIGFAAGFKTTLVCVSIIACEIGGAR